MKSTLFILITALSLLFLAGCMPEPEFMYDEERVNFANTEFTGSSVIYEVSINKPTPCHVISHRASISTSENINTFLIHIEMTIGDDEICPQVIMPETITGEIETNVIPTKVKFKWSYQTNSEIVASPVIMNNKIVVGSTDGVIYCIDIFGNLLWEFKTDYSIEASALILDNKVYVGNLKGNFYVINLDTGEEIWSYKSRNQINAAANYWSNGSDNFIIFGDYDYYLNCLNAETGKLIWQYEAMNFIHSSVAIVGDFAVFGGCDGFLHLVDLKTGKALRNIEIATYIASTPALKRGHAFIGDYDGKFSCVNIVDEQIKWQFNNTKKEVAIIGAPAIQNRRVLFGSRDNHVYCLNIFNGNLLWKKNTGARIDASLVTDKKNVLVCNLRGDIMLINLNTGNTVWNYEIGSQIIGNPAIGQNIIVFGAADGNIYCLEKDLK